MKLTICNLDEMFDPDRVITSSEALNKDGTFAANSIYSPALFGTMDGTEKTFSCTCGNLRGRTNDGLKCEICGTECKEAGSKIENLGWIDISNEFKLIHPAMYPFIEKYIGPKKLNNILYTQIPIDIDGNICKSREPKSSSNPYPELSGLGIPDFEENFDSIIELFKPSKADDDKMELYRFIRANRDKVFFSKFPVISAKLRPCLVRGKQVIQDELNTKYLQLTRLVSCYRTLGFDNEPLSVFPLFAKMQQIVNDLYKSIIESLNGKTGIIRNLMLAGRLNFSARSVIVPTPLDEAPDAVYVPYIAGLELFKLQVMGRLHREYGITIEEAKIRVENAQRGFDEVVYEMACEELGEGFPVILNRNPSISIGSAQKVRITKIKSDPSDYTMNISVMIFAPLNADLDGDVLNLFLLPNNGKKAFNNMRPFDLIFNFNDGKVNSSFLPRKDHRVGLDFLVT